MQRKVIIYGVLFILILTSLALYKFRVFREGSKSYPAAGYDKPEGFIKYFREITIPIGSSVSGYKSNYRYNELMNAKKRAFSKNATVTSFEWIQRGPVNVGGRTRCILVDPDDPKKKTWFAGSASGGIWKTTDGGLTWTDITPDLPNLATTTLCMAPTDHNLIFAGTGEGYGGEGMVAGNGIFVSNDRGLSWQLLTSTDGNPEFRYVNKIWIDPLDKNVIIAVTNTAVMKSVNGGQSWQVKYKDGNRVQDIVQNPLNPNVLYAGVNTSGVIKSIDKGETWFKSNSGILQGRRFALAISAVDTSNVFTCVENLNAEMDVYMSDNAGLSWTKQKDLSGTFFNFHKAQGWFNSVIKCHPFNENEVYVAGVYMGKVSFTNDVTLSDPQVLLVDTVGTSPFLDFINFGGGWLGGGMSTGLIESANVTVNDFVSVQLRFGPGKHQKAHRFMVPEGRSSGVPAIEYTYYDYVDIPFEAWDVKNNKQLVISFRDQERDGEFNLIEREPGNDLNGREYIFVQAIEYDSANPSPLVTKNGGHYEKMMYFFWPTLTENMEWNHLSLPSSTLNIDFGRSFVRTVTTTNIQDENKNTNLHVDHHDLVIIPGPSPTDTIRLIDANDGGVAYSGDGGKTWTQLTNGFITTQFYGVAKKPGANEYIGGMQDNGTWQSRPGTEATDETMYLFRVGGDGCQVLWNNLNPSRILASSYENLIYLSANGGSVWLYAGSSIGDDGPFLTKLSNSRLNPNLVFAVGANGVYRHMDFGRTSSPWELTAMGNGWTFNSGAYSSMHVKVSGKDSSVVWAGMGMYEDPVLNIFLSRDFGVTFDTVTRYNKWEMGLISGMATHPENAAEAFLLFSYRGEPKILRTYNFGESWTDITKFGPDSISSNGFPDVIVHDLLVLPMDTSILWAATEIGIFESTNNGENWHILEGNLPSVSVFQLFYQDHQFVAATHGRGIWTANLWPVGINEEVVKKEQSINIYPNPASDYLDIELTLPKNAQATIRVISLSGQIILSEDTRLEAGVNTVRRMDISSLKTGTYVLEVKYGTRSQTARFIKR